MKLEIWVVIVVGLFLLARKFMLWYWRINRIVELLEFQWQQSKSLSVQITRLSRQMEHLERTPVTSFDRAR